MPGQEVKGRGPSNLESIRGVEHAEKSHVARVAVRRNEGKDGVLMDDDR